MMEKGLKLIVNKDFNEGYIVPGIFTTCILTLLTDIAYGNANIEKYIFDGFNIMLGLLNHIYTRSKSPILQDESPFISRTLSIATIALLITSRFL